MSNDEQKAPEAPKKATRSNPGAVAEKNERKPKITKLPDGTIKEDY